MWICMSEYPDFDGTASAWNGVKENSGALLEAQRLDKLVDIKDEDAHGLKIDVKQGYEESNQLFYSILNNVCTKGLEKFNIKKSNDQIDISLAWKTLKEYCDQDSDKESFELRY